MKSETTKKDTEQQAKAVDSDLGRGWMMPEGRANSLRAGLYVVATPIGNLGDMSFRALDVLAGAGAVFCEDTRQTGKLLSYFGVLQRLSVYNDHSEASVRQKIIASIESGEAVALVSDAGMPLVSDPGYKLVSDIQAAGLSVTSVPGANAPLAALQLSGLPSDKFCFLGFLPSKQGARKSVLGEWKAVPATLLMFETAPRLQAALADMVAVLGARDIAVVREITKKFEEVRKGSAAELSAYYAQEGAPKGEIVIVISPPEAVEYGDDVINAMLSDALQDLSTKDAAAKVAGETGLPKKVLYQKALEVAKGDV